VTILRVYLIIASKVFGSELSGYSHRICSIQARVPFSSQVNSRPTSSKNTSTPILAATRFTNARVGYQSEHSKRAIERGSLSSSAISGIIELANKGLLLRAREAIEPSPMTGFNDTSYKTVSESDIISRLEIFADGWDSDYPEITILMIVGQFEELELKIREYGALKG
jgi:hypothetical protein